jgi:hypothetical protein
MTNQSTDTTPATIVKDNMMTIHSYLHESYSQVSIHMQQGFDFFKQEFRGMFEQVETCFTNMMLPVNNFLKAPEQIETEFQQLAINVPEGKTSPNIVPLEIALLSPMEENY